MSTLDDIKQTFFLECEELLEALNDGLNEIETSLPEDLDPETVNAVFRAVHSIKGGAASFGLEAVVRFSHCFESVLDHVRAGRLRPDQEGVRVFHRAADHLADLIAACRSGEATDLTGSEPLLAQLADMAGEGATDKAPAPDPDPIAAPVADSEGDLTFAPLAMPLDLGTGQSARTTYEIAFTAGQALFANGHDPVHLFRELAGLGELTVAVAAQAVPALDQLDTESCHLSWTCRLETDSTEDEVREIFEFVDGLAEFAITPGGEAMPSSEPGPVPSPDDAATEPLSTFRAPDEAPAARKSPQVAAAKKSTVRVDLDLVDSLINIVGELVINQAVLAQSALEANVAHRSDVGAALDEYKSLALQIQECVMSLRAQSVKQLFQRMARIVRETSEIAGKLVAFETEGEDTEIDKTVIERLIDPLTHILRNAIDHGLESTEDRVRAGKRVSGTVRLSAAHRSGRVVIEVSDDGGGIDRDRVFAIAVDKGLVAADAQLVDSEIDRLLFLPGFSTKSAVTDLSGRGVGMDVVRSEIQKLGGRVAIVSAPGRGTTFSISLPLTLAVLDGMVVDVAGHTMVVPITSVVETIRPVASEIHMIGARTQAVSVRDTLVPIVELGHAFAYRHNPALATETVLLLVETEQRQRWALAVDRIIDQRQVVIKSLEGNYGHVPGVSAATILGDGKIALIIDPEETAGMAEPVPMLVPALAATGA